MEISKHFWVDLKFDSVVRSSNGQNVPFNVIVFLYAFDPLAVNLYEQVNENAQASSDKTYDLPVLKLI